MRGLYGRRTLVADSLNSRIGGVTTIETDRYPRIASEPAVHGGAPIVGGTRLPVRTIAFYWREGWDKQRILANFPRLTTRALAEALRYYREHRAEIDEELRADAETA
jgi:uncharacterized protein (DUF433 family)